MTENKGTKQIVLDKALSLFAISAYEGVTVADIANAVGIKAPSLYKHYKSKQDIFDAILIEMEERYKKQVTPMQMDGMDADKDMGLFMNISEKQLIEMGKGVFLYFLHDDYAQKFRRMLTIEQYRSQKLSALYAKQYIDDPLSYQGMLFGLLLYQEDILAYRNDLAYLQQRVLMQFQACIYFMDFQQVKTKEYEFEIL